MKYLPPMPGGGLPTTQVLTSVIFMVRADPPARVSAPFQPVMIAGALVLPVMLPGKIEASMTRRPSTPCTFSRGSTTDEAGSGPMRQVEHRMVDRARAAAEIVDQVGVGLHGRSRQDFSAISSAIAGCAAMVRTNFTAASISSTSCIGRIGVGDDLWIAARVGRADHDLAARGGPRVGQADGEARPRVGREEAAARRPLGSPSKRPGNRAACSAARDRVGAEEAAAIVDRQRQRPGAGQQILHAPTSALPHQGRRIWFSVGTLALKV
jgi:hypothetical protein